MNTDPIAGYTPEQAKWLRYCIEHRRPMAEVLNVVANRLPGVVDEVQLQAEMARIIAWAERQKEQGHA